MPRIGLSGAEQAARAAAPRTGSSGDKWLLTPRTGTSGAEQAAGAAAPPTWIIQGQVAEDARHWIIRGRTRTSSHNPQDGIIRGEEARRPRQDRPGRIKLEEPLPPRQVRKQHKGQRHGGAMIQGLGRLEKKQCSIDMAGPGGCRETVQGMRPG